MLKKIIILPFEDFFSGLDSALTTVSAVNIGVIFVLFALTWWVYVPIHELAHALGCIIGGGTVSRLEISPLYGGGVLERIFPFVYSGSDYAGQLTGFDTMGSDVAYMLTVFLPFLLTIVLGVPLLRSAAGSPPLAASVKLGVALPIAFAPFISFSGDYYEMGSIVVSRIAEAISVAANSAAWNSAAWRSDDVFKLGEELFFSGKPYSTADVLGVVSSFVLGVVFIYVTYLLGVLWSNVLGIGKKKSPAS
ncbi:MAG: hypothetical protein R3B51_03825 [Thermodesulfobacteriota bacterium]